MTIVMQQTVSKSQFKAHALELLRMVEKQNQSLIITHGGKPVVKVISYKEVTKPEDVLKSLRGSVLRYDNPTEPVGSDDWDMLK